MISYESLQALAPAGAVVTIERGASPGDEIVRLIAPKGKVFDLYRKGGGQRVCEIEAWVMDNDAEMPRTVKEYFACLAPAGG